MNILELKKLIDETKNWFTLFSSLEEFEKILSTINLVYKKFLIPKLFTVLGEDGQGFKSKNGLDQIYLILQEYKSFEEKLKILKTIDQVLRWLKPLSIF